MRNPLRRPAGTAVLAATLVLLAAGAATGGESWHASTGAGVLLFGGGQPSHSGPVATLRLGYDLDAPVSIELGGLAGGFDGRRFSPDDQRRGVYGSWADAIIHLARWERLDPFISAGAGVLWSDCRALPDNRRTALVPRLGAGAMYTLSEHWSVRAGATAMTTHPNDRHACFGLVEAGLFYYFGDTTPERPEQAR